ncbi:Rz1-like lysis system protein LysC [Pantoea ananatis]|uniref:Rz1-like lysis system protein LysC n=1 Tax=Pantoea ananas TaxID=553 RepID=UPI003B9833A9
MSQPRLNLPAELTSQIGAPAPPEMMTFGDSVSLNAELYGILAQCNIDRAAIRQIESSR